MPSKIGESIENIKHKAFEGVVNFAGFVFTPIQYYITKRMHIRHVIAKDVLVSSEWIVLTPKKPIKRKNRFLGVLLELEKCRQKVNKPKKSLIFFNGTVINPNKPINEKLIFSDGTIIIPKKQISVEIFDENDNGYKLESIGFGVNDYDKKDNTYSVRSAHFRSYKIELPRDKRFTKIRIRSEKPFFCKNVILYDFNMK